METNLKLVRYDETEYWNKEFLKRIGAKKVTAIYLFDANRTVRCCEITPSYELYPVTTHTDNHLSDDDYEEFEDTVRMDKDVTYCHCAPVDEIAEDYLEGENFEYKEGDDNYWLKMEEAALDFNRFNLHLTK